MEQQNRFYPMLDRQIDRILDSFHLALSVPPSDVKAIIMKTAWFALKQMREGLERSPMTQYQAEMHVLRWMLCREDALND